MVKIGNLESSCNVNLELEIDLYTKLQIEETALYVSSQLPKFESPIYDKKVGALRNETQIFL